MKSKEYITTKIPKDLHERIKRLAEREERTQQAIFRRLLTFAIKQAEMKS